MKGGDGGAVRTERIVVGGFGYRVQLAGAGPAIVLLHGFTGNGDGWAPFLPALARYGRVIVPDLPGHGGTDVPKAAGPSEPPPAPGPSFGPGRDMARWADDVGLILDALGERDAVVIGYSLGGRTALTWAARRPDRVRALVLESASPGIDSEEERRRRREQDEALAKFIEEEGVAAFVDRWEELPLFASQKNLPEDLQDLVRRRRLGNSAPGLAASLRCMGAGVMEPLHGRLASLTMPVLLLAGSLDEKYCRLAREMGGLFPRATVHVVDGAGHAVHLERPERWLASVERFLRDMRTESTESMGSN